ncbi:unnamed protein product [Didymodactylos carnosus]|uniref:Uncharacterized protein n=1 Tax=Didymodactylos carnosus TaxID=1234261 RepID=A0A815XZR2_9BILA|nr:unnamed protein product [Didymodactylos carnosus]CAF4425706.1 unnamed protein product [Didymodactylos carnosus]
MTMLGFNYECRNSGICISYDRQCDDHCNSNYTNDDNFFYKLESIYQFCLELLSSTERSNTHPDKNCFLGADEYYCNTDPTPNHPYRYYANQFMRKYILTIHLLIYPLLTKSTTEEKENTTTKSFSTKVTNIVQSMTDLFQTSLLFKKNKILVQAYQTYVKQKSFEGWICNLSIAVFIKNNQQQ